MQMMNGYTDRIYDAIVRLSLDDTDDMATGRCTLGIENRVNGTPVENLAYAYDALARPVSRNGDAFGYNARGEVVFSRGDAENAEESYAYDHIGNAVLAASGGVTNAYAANTLNQYASILRGSGTPCEILPQYDVDGNMTSDGTFSYAYDAENRLISATPVSPSLGSLAVENGYDHQHRRIRKTVKRFNGETWNEAETHTFVYDGNNIALESVADANGTSQTIEYFWGNDLSGTEQGAGGVGGLLAVSLDGVFHLPCYDHNGNIVCYVLETGAIAAQHVYDPYGGVIESSGPFVGRFSFGFSTKYHDRETGLVAYQRRFYSPSLGRWLNRDPIEENGGENLYGFCGNNPIVNYDKNGNAYFAVRGLGKVLPPVNWSWLFSCPFMKFAADVAADVANVQLLHEQLFFENGSNIGWGNDDEGLGVGKEIRDESSKRYARRDGGYDDCVMRKSVKEVNVGHYQLTWVGARTKCNCQDYADMLRVKYWELINNPKIRCQCGLDE